MLSHQFVMLAGAVTVVTARAHCMPIPSDKIPSTRLRNLMISLVQNYLHRIIIPLELHDSMVRAVAYALDFVEARSRNPGLFSRRD